MTPIKHPDIQTLLPRVAGAIQISARVRAVLDGRYPLTVLRAARGFGKTSVLVTWLRRTTDQIPTIYHALDQRSITEDGFWSHLAATLERAGLPFQSDSKDLRQRVLDTITDLPAPMRLILDDMHEAGAETRIDDDLVDLVRSNDRFYLIAAGRSPRELENTGPLSVEAAVLGPEDLKLTGRQVSALAADLGIELQADCAAQIVQDIGGWPAAIRAGLTNATPESAVDEPRVAGYLSTVLRDMRMEIVRTFFLRTAVPEYFDTAMAGILVPEDQNGLALHRIKVAGLLREQPGPDGASRFSYPPAIRRALRRVLREREPEWEAQIHQRLMRAAATNHNPTQVIEHAARAQRWDIVSDVLEQHWVPLLTTAPAVLVQVAEQAPPELAEQDPRLRILHKHRAVFVASAGTLGTQWPVTDPPTMAAEIIARVTHAEHHVDEEGLALVLWGAACLTGGNHDIATYAFNQARACGFSSGSGATAVIGTVGLALVHALNGEPTLARQWLAEPELHALFADQGSDEDPRARDMVIAAASIARALAAVDHASPEAEHAVAGLINPRHRGDLWATSVFARAHHVAIGDDPEEVFRQSNQVRAALRHVARGSLVDTVLTSTLVELQLFARMSGVALETAQQLDADPIGWTTLAKAHLGRQDFEQAVMFARRAINAERISMRSLLESHVVLAAAHHGRGENALARRAFADAVGVAQATGQRRPFHLMRRYVFEVLAKGDESTLRLWPGASAAQTSRGLDRDQELPTFTMREAQVLRALERHAGPMGIARSLDVSVNTVKTHLRAVYRKLGVSSRNEALDVLGRSGLKAPDGA